MTMHKCIRNVNHSLVQVEENKRKATFRNPDRSPYSVARVDNCLITDGQRCDYMVSHDGVCSVLIELKGTDVEHACKQLLASVVHPTVTEKREKIVGFLVVCSRYPRFDTFVAKAKIECAKKYKAGFHVVTQKGEFDIARVTAIDGPY